jgi:hypothetical protein
VSSVSLAKPSGGGQAGGECAWKSVWVCLPRLPNGMFLLSYSIGVKFEDYFPGVANSVLAPAPRGSFVAQAMKRCGLSKPREQTCLFRGLVRPHWTEQAILCVLRASSEAGGEYLACACPMECLPVKCVHAFRRNILITFKTYQRPPALWKIRILFMR